MNLNELKQSKFLKKEDCDPPITVTIDGIKQENVGMESEPEKLRYVLYFREVEKGLVLNVENGEMLAELFPKSHLDQEDSDPWIGRRIVLWNNPTIKFGPKRVGGIRIRGVSGNPAPEPRPKRNHFAKEMVENYSEPTMDQVNADLQEASELNRRKHQPSSEPVEDDDESLPF
jgi:hypothetical protein